MTRRPASKRRSSSLQNVLLVLFFPAIAALPFLSVVLADAPGACLADPQSELPVKLWVYDAYLQPDRIFGGLIAEIRHPHPGPLNNPDLLGTLVVGGLNGRIGDCGAYNLLVFLQLLANALAAWRLGSAWAGDRLAGLGSAVTLGLLPLLLVYCVAGAITDMLNVWPFLLSLLLLQQAWQGRSAGRALGAGALLALGFILCPYNILVFAPALLPLGLGLYLGLPQRFGLAAWPGGKPALRLVACAALGGILAGAPYVIWLKLIMAAADSQMAAEAVGATRHAYPYDALAPLVSERYTAFLLDFIAVGGDSVVLRDNVARFYRANNPGLVALALGLLAALMPGADLTRRAAARLWMGVAAFFMVAATGPFLPLTAQISLPGPYNLLWLGLHRLFPGSYLLLEPFRYGLVVGAAVAIAAALGARRLADRWGRWVYPLVPLLMVLELLTLAPLFRPLPTTVPHVPAVYSQIDDYLPPGAIVELPFYQFGSKLFNRRVFLNQRSHQRPIPHQVEGFPPGYLVDNPATATLIAAEDPLPFYGHGTGDRAGMNAGIAQLKADGFVGILINPSLYKEGWRAEQVAKLLRPWGPPVQVDGRWIYRL